MKAIVVMFDSLNRHFLPNYGCDWVHAPTFKRLAQRALTFDSSYIASMPCMPARRDWHTARPNFLHRSWGPLEPYDDSVPSMLKKAGVYTHLATDHYHYWEDGGANYHTRYNTSEFFRGQEGDHWLGHVGDPPYPKAVAAEWRDRSAHWRQDWINRDAIKVDSQTPQSQTFSAGLDFIRRNAGCDNWMLHIETFDPHEPFFTLRQWKDLYPSDYNGYHFDWPPYKAVNESPEIVEHCRREYAALVSKCDASLGDVLDMMDNLDMWKDTMLIVWTDHGFMLGEHNCWAKMWQPWYEELSHTPFFAWDPRSGKRGERRSALVQPALDVGPTLLEFFGVPPTPLMLGKPLHGVIADDSPVRQAAIFGAFGHAVNVTDGRYTYWRYPPPGTAGPLNRYTINASHMRDPYAINEFEGVTLAPPFVYTKGCPTLRIPVKTDPPKYESTLFDLRADPGQTSPLKDATVERKMIDHLVALMAEAEAPGEQYQRLGLTPPANAAPAAGATIAVRTGCADGEPIQDCRHLGKPQDIKRTPKTDTTN